MQLALETLGYSMYPMTSAISNMADADVWFEAFDAKYLHKPSTPTLDRAFWDIMLGHVFATTDLPTAAFFEEIVAAYPSVKCVLVEREAGSWCGFRHAVHIAIYDNWLCRVMAATDQNLIGKMSEAVSICKAVKEKLPKVQLLLYRLESGWSSLCEFLDKPVPRVPFPRGNETEFTSQYVQTLLRIGLIDTLRRWAWQGTPIAVASAASWSIWR